MTVNNRDIVKQTIQAIVNKEQEIKKLQAEGWDSATIYEAQCALKSLYDRAYNLMTEQ